MIKKVLIDKMIQIRLKIAAKSPKVGIVVLLDQKKVAWINGCYFFTGLFQSNLIPIIQIVLKLWKNDYPQRKNDSTKKRHYTGPNFHRANLLHFSEKVHHIIAFRTQTDAISTRKFKYTGSVKDSEAALKTMTRKNAAEYLKIKAPVSAFKQNISLDHPPLQDEP